MLTDNDIIYSEVGYLKYQNLKENLEVLYPNCLKIIKPKNLLFF